MLKKWINELDLKRLAVLAVGPGLLLLGVDAWISHFAGKDDSVPAQWIPVFYAPVAAVFAMIWALPKLKLRTFQIGMIIIGGLAVAIGLLGTGLHAVPLWADLSDEKLSWSAIQGALSNAPPMFAPLGFTGVGGLLIALAHPRLILSLMPKGAKDDKSNLAQHSSGGTDAVKGGDAAKERAA